VYVQAGGSGGGALTAGAGMSAAKDSVLQQSETAAIADWRSLCFLDISQPHPTNAKCADLDTWRRTGSGDGFFAKS
jgi:hypothetical protein